MGKIRTTMDPRREIEVSDAEETVLRHQGLVYEGTDADLQALLDRDPVNALSPRVVLPQAPKAAAVAAPPAAAKTGA